MNIMKIPKRKPKVGNEPEGNRGGDHGTSRFKKDSSAVPTCSIIYPLKKKKASLRIIILIYTTCMRVYYTHYCLV